MIGSDIAIRPADAADALAITEVRIAAWRETYRGFVPDDYLDAMSSAEHAPRMARALEKDRRRAAFVAVADGHGVVGFGVCGPGRGGLAATPGEFYALYLLRAAQGRGVGRRLMMRLADHLRRLELEPAVALVMRENRGAIAFYRRLGGRPVGEATFEIGGQTIVEVAMQWPTLRDLIESDGNDGETSVGPEH